MVVRVTPPASVSRCRTAPHRGRPHIAPGSPRALPLACRACTADSQGSRRFLARIVSEQVPAAAVPFVPELLPGFCERLVQHLALKAKGKGGTITATDGHADALARAAFAAIGIYRDDDAKALMALFRDKGEAETVCRRVLAAALGRKVAEIQEAE